jgi:hypothetical protein
LKAGGAKHLVSLLGSSDKVTVFETVLNIVDLVLDHEDKIQPENKANLLSLEVVPALNRILSNPPVTFDKETIEEVQKLRDLFIE